MQASNDLSTGFTPERTEFLQERRYIKNVSEKTIQGGDHSAQKGVGTFFQNWPVVTRSTPQV